MGIDISKIKVDEEAVLSIASFIVTSVVPLVAPGAAIIPVAVERVIPIARRMIQLSKADHFDPAELDALMKILEDQSALIQKDPDEPVAAPV